MKNIEKIAIDSLIQTIETELSQDISQMSNFKRQFEEAKKNFQGAAGKLISSAKKSVADIVDELSEEGIAYLEAEISSKLTVPFKLK